MYESRNSTDGHNSQLSFYEYPSHKPYINSVRQPLRPSFALSRTVSLPESNRDELLQSFQTLAVKIKNLETERERAEESFHQLTNDLSRSFVVQRASPPVTIDEQLEEAETNFRRLQDQHRRVVQLLGSDQRPATAKQRPGRKKKRANRSLDTTLNSHSEGRHYRLDVNDIPFILGSSTTPSHNVKTNVQKVISLLRRHNQQLCSSAKEYADLLPSSSKSDLSPHTLLYLDHYRKSSSASPSKRSASAVPVVRSTSQRRPKSDQPLYSRIRSLRREFAILSREHARLSLMRDDADGDEDVQILSRRMEIILEELERLQREYMRASREHMESDADESPLDTLRRTKLLQLILKDPIARPEKY